MCTVRFISDLHFGHHWMAKHRGFDNVEDHDNLIINNWNKTVKKKDLTYVLGDISMDSVEEINKLNLLNGTIRIIGGNHDTRRVCKELNNRNFEVLGCMDYKGFIVSHIPIHPRELDFCRGNIHGHTHEVKISTGYFNVSAECINYTPITLEQLTNGENKERELLHF